MTITLDVETSTVPGPRPWMPGTSLLKFQRDPLAFFTEMHRTGDIAGFKFGPQQVLLGRQPGESSVPEA
jgi:hypothetical protein